MSVLGCAMSAALGRYCTSRRLHLACILLHSDGPSRALPPVTCTSRPSANCFLKGDGLVVFCNDLGMSTRYVVPLAVSSHE